MSPPNRPVGSGSVIVSLPGHRPGSANWRSSNPSNGESGLNWQRQPSSTTRRSTQRMGQPGPVDLMHPGRVAGLGEPGDQPNVIAVASMPSGRMADSPGRVAECPSPWPSPWPMPV